MLEIFLPPQPGPDWKNNPNMSPFCLKLETYVRMAKIPYVAKRGNPMKAPKGRLPYVRLDGHWIGDSGFIIDELKCKFGDVLDEHLSALEKAQGLAFRRMLEEHTFFCAACERWGEEYAYTHLRSLFLTVLPPVLGSFIMQKVRKRALQTFSLQGAGAHTAEERLSLIKNDVNAVSEFLGNKKYFFGDKPTSYDATVFACIGNLMWVPWESDVTRFVSSKENLKLYCERMRSEFWS